MEQSLDQGVGGEIKRLRNERDWSMARLAVEADMSVSGVSMIENGKRNLTTTTLAKLARAFGVEVADLFPKAEAPLWSDETPGRRYPAFSFEEAREALERYCARWEEVISEGKLDDRAIGEFLATGDGWLPILDIALGAEIRARGLVDGDTDIGKVNRRYLRVFDEVISALKDRIDTDSGEPPTEVSNVVDLRGFRDRYMKRAVG